MSEGLTADTSDLPPELAHYDEAIEKIRGQFVGMRIKVGKAPQTAKWDEASKRAALSAVDNAAEDSVTMSSRLLDPKIESVGKVNDVLAKINDVKMDRRFTLPFTQPGIRLVRMGGADLDNLKRLEERLTALKHELSSAAEFMYYDMDNIRDHMRAKLKKLYDPKNYDFDPRLRYVVSWQFVDVEVPSYLRHNAELLKKAENDLKAEMREAVLLAEQQLAENMFFVIDNLVERLENRRVVDEKHEVLSVVDRGEVRIVEFRNKDKKNVEIAEMSEDEFNERVTDDSRRKIWKDYTASKIFDELEHAERQLVDIGLGRGEMEKVFSRLKGTVQHQTRKNLVKDLKENSDYREHFRKRLESIGESMLDLTVVQGRRDIVRKRSRSKKFNPEKV